ncbi:MAG: branched-chain amino acid ABC transporter permease [Alphaproteobacteria bacterium]|nr:branched-chain amino acid ABC transporter permease [Alphaproteobacteria bacterium]
MSEIVGNSRERARRSAAASSRWRLPELAFWGCAVAAIFLLPSRHLLLNEIAIVGLFAMSIDLILGYAGIVSLGHAAFFGVGAYAAGLLAKSGYVEPASGLLFAGAIAATVGFSASFLVIRGSDLTRLMVTLGVALVFVEVANRFESVTGGVDGLLGISMGPILGLFEFDFGGTTAYCYSLCVLFVMFLIARRIVNSPFGTSLRALKENRMRAGAIGIPTAKRIVAVYSISAGFAGIAGALLAQTTAFVSLEVLDFARSADGLLILVIGGSGYLYGGIIGSIAFALMRDALSTLTPAYWLFWMGAILVALVVVGRERIVDCAKALSLRVRGQPK